MANPLVRLGGQFEDIPEHLGTFLSAFRKAFMEQSPPPRRALPPASRPRPAAPQATQLRVPLRQPAGARNYSGRAIGGQATRGGSTFPRDTETARLGMQRSVGETPTIPRPVNRVPGQQLDLLTSAPAPAFTTRFNPAQYSNEVLNVGVNDPGTLTSLQRIAASVEDTYGVPAQEALERLVQGGPSGGTNYLRQLESTAIVPSPRGAMQPPTGAGALQRINEPGGALVRSPGGVLNEISPVQRVTVFDATPGAPRIGAQSPRPGGSVDYPLASDVSRIGGSVDYPSASDVSRIGGSVDYPSASDVSRASRQTFPSDGPIDVNSMRNAVGGIRMADLGNMNPYAVAAGFGVAGGLATLGGYGLGNLANQQSIMGQPTASPGRGPNFPAVTGEEVPGTTAPITQAAPLASPISTLPNRDEVGAYMSGAPVPPPIGQQPVPSAPVLPPPGVAGAGQVVTRTRGDRNADLRTEYQRAMAGSRLAMQPGEMKDYNEAGSYYGVRGNYAASPEGRKQTQQRLQEAGGAQAFGVESQAAFDTWARANPALAYDLAQRRMPRLPQQQMPTQTGVALGTSFGTNNANNPVGAAVASADAAVRPSQGAVDMADALRPQVYPVLKNVDYREVEQLFYGPDGINRRLATPGTQPR